MPKTDITESLVGGDVISLITAGMYINPLAIYREYIQNAVDAIATVSDHRGRIEIDIDPVGLRLSIRDNGPGLSPEKARRALVPIARSEKKRGTDRGFRGIGRLAGLAFAQTVTFVTRSNDDDQVTRITWDGPTLQCNLKDHPQTDKAILESVRFETLPGDGWPKHFFDVEVAGIARHAAGLVLNKEAVRAYIGEVCPVPISSTFPFKSEIEGVLENDGASFVLDVFIDGETEPITRRFDDEIPLQGDRKVRFTECERLDIPALDLNSSAAVGWIAHSSYSGMILQGAGIRGFRARIGNIQIGDEAVFEHLFPEDRFNRWCIGELHILDSRILPNSRRDYFEPGPHVRNLENQLRAVFRGIANRCRKSSTVRNAERRYLLAISEIEEAYELAASGYLPLENARSLVQKTLNQIEDIKNRINITSGDTKIDLDKLEFLENKLIYFNRHNGRPTARGIPRSERKTYRKFFQAIAEVSDSPRTARALIKAVLERT